MACWLVPTFCATLDRMIRLTLGRCVLIFFLWPSLCFFWLRFLLSMLRELGHFALQFFVQSSGKCFQILVDFITAFDQLL